MPTLFRGPPVLHVLRDGAEVLRVPLREGPLVVGRSQQCDLALPDPTRRLSRQHLVLWFERGRVKVEDRSTAGCRLHGRTLHRGQADLHAGDCLELGPWVLRLDAGRSAEESTVLPTEATAVALDAEERFFALVARSGAMRELLREVRRLGPFTIPVLVHGETGAGKEGVARGLHVASPRCQGPWITLNCGALHPGTAHATLFGHERGAFTGALERRAGAFVEARGGTLFLDEVGDLPAELQAALLRVLETREVTPMGASRAVPTDFRLVTATHKNLVDEVAAGRFREDLYYRIAVATLRVPPIRERPDDLEALARQFLHIHAPGSAAALLPGAVHALRGHPWPGNVRELRNVVLQAFLAATPGPIEPGHVLRALAQRLGSAGPRLQTEPEVPRAPQPTEPAPERSVKDALALSGGNRSEAARSLGIARSTLYERLRREAVELA